MMWLQRTRETPVCEDQEGLSPMSPREKEGHGKQVASEAAKGETGSPLEPP